MSLRLCPLPSALLLLAGLSAATAAPARADESSDPIPTRDRRPLHAIALTGRGVFIPQFLMGIGLSESQALNSGGVGLSYIYRKGTLDVVTSLDFAALSPPDGNFLGVGKRADIDTHYTQFRDLNMVSLDVSFFWVSDINKYLAFQIGGGFGLGLMLGDVLVVNNSGAGCSGSTVGDVEKCHPNVEPSFYTRVGNPAPTWTDASGRVQPLSGPLLPSDPDFSLKLDGLAASQQACKAQDTGKSDCRDTADHPYAHKAPEKPPVIPVLHFEIGLKIKAHRHLNINLTGGFKNGLVIGGGPEYVF